MCVGEVQCPKGAMTEAQKGLRERNMSLFSVGNYLLGFRRISRVNILVPKKADFRHSAEDWHPCKLFPPDSDYHLHHRLLGMAREQHHFTKFTLNFILYKSYPGGIQGTPDRVTDRGEALGEITISDLHINIVKNSLT